MRPRRVRPQQPVNDGQRLDELPRAEAPHERQARERAAQRRLQIGAAACGAAWPRPRRILLLLVLSAEELSLDCLDDSLWLDLACGPKRGDSEWSRRGAAGMWSYVHARGHCGGVSRRAVEVKNDNCAC